MRRAKRQHFQPADDLVNSKAACAPDGVLSGDRLGVTRKIRDCKFNRAVHGLEQVQGRVAIDAIQFQFEREFIRPTGGNTVACDNPA